MIVTDVDLDSYSKLKGKRCNLCNEYFKAGQSYEKITTHRKSKLIIHTECVKKGI